ncbi:hypothetical protein JL722_2244 [Aureococcus anophagefferens]|nr:hypothetical protein JL722_2244 [Aureococcus anophagefferens]
MAEFKSDDEDPLDLSVRNVGAEGGAPKKVKKKTTSFMAGAHSAYKGAKKMMKKQPSMRRVRETDEAPGGRAELGQIAELIEHLAHDDLENRVKAAAELRVLALDGDNKVAIVAAHGIGPLVDLCRDGTNEENAAAAECAARALWNLSINNDNKVAIAESGAIGPLVTLLSKGGTIGAKEAAAGALRNLAVNVDNQPLVGLCKNGHSVVCKEAAAGALRNLTYNNNVNRNAMAAAGAVPILVDMCKQGENEMSQMHAAALLKNLTSSPQCIAAVAKELGLGDPNAASKTDVDAELTPKSSPTRAGGRISKTKFSNSSAK